MERQRVHVVMVHHILAQLRIIGAQHPLGRFGADVALTVVAGVKQQPRAAFHADVTDPEKQRAVRLTVPLDAEQLAAGIDAIDLWLETADALV